MAQYPSNYNKGDKDSEERLKTEPGFHCQRSKAITNTMVEVVFSDSNALDVESACDIDCYEIDENLEILDAK